MISELVFYANFWIKTVANSSVNLQTRWSVLDLENFMLNKGYSVHSKVVIDYIFVKNA